MNTPGSGHNASTIGVRHFVHAALSRFAASAAPAESKAAQPHIQLYGPVARWGDRNYRAFANAGFATNAVAYRSVRMVSEAVAGIDWRVLEGGREATDHPAITLLGACPEHTCFAELIEELVGHYLLSGNAYVHARMIGDAVGGLASLRPDRMTVKTDRAGWPTGFDYTNGTQRLHFPSRTASGVAPVLHLKSFHPTDDHYGLAPLQAAATAIEIHNAASAWNKALLDNAARPSGALVYQASGGKLSDLQFERLKTELEDGFQGARNAGRPLLLEGGLDWKSMGLSPRDMDFLEAKNGAAREIALAIGVPPMLLGIPGDNTFANYKEANRAFWRQTVLPLARKLTAAFTQWLQPISPAPFTLKLQTDNLPALASETESLWAQLSASDFLTDGEKRARAGFPPRSPSS